MSSSSRKMLQAAAGSAGGDFYDYTIENSVRVEHGPSTPTRLYRTNTTGGNRKTWTMSFWVKKCRLNTLQYVFNANVGPAWPSSNNNFLSLHFNADIINVQSYAFTPLQTTAVFRDASAWYHIILAFDSTQSTASNRLKLYVNGTEITAFTTDNRSSITQNFDFPINANSCLLNINANYTTSAYNGIDGYYADFAVIDGQQLTPTSFGKFKNGIWIPKDLSGLTFGTNGFWLKFDNASALGTDSSGNGNNFTSSGLTSSDQMIDTPTNNHCVLNPLWKDVSTSGTIVFSEGNTVSNTQGTGGQHVFGTMAIPSTGKWYFEVECTDINPSFCFQNIGLSSQSASVRTVAYSLGDVTYAQNGNKYINGTGSAYGSSFTTGDVIGVACDSDSGTVTFYKNNSSQGSISINPAGLLPFTGDSVSIGYSAILTWNFSSASFTYTPPTDHLALCTANLPEPAIGPNSTTTSGEHFNTVLYTGNGSTQSVTGVGFQPDFTWVKKRSGAERHVLFDAVRGAGYQLSSDLAVAEVYLNYTLTSFDSDGFSNGNNGYTNESGHTYVAWNWKANGSGVTNTDGSITSTVSANTDAGISIVTGDFSASGTDTVGHGLGVAPDMIILKNRSLDYNWLIWHNSFTVSEYLAFTAGSKGTYSNLWGSSLPSSTVFGFSGGVYNGDTFVAYCFAEKEGFSKIGSYTGNGSTDGPFIYCGFRPAFIMTKRTDTSGYWWEMVDTAREPYNPSDQTLYANVSDTEYTNSVYDKDLLSNGFKIRGTNGGHNASGGTYIYMAFAEMPFKYSAGR